MKGSVVFDRLYRGLTKINAVAVTIASISILLMVAIVLFSVIMRYVIGKPVILVPDIPIYLLMLSAFIAAGYTLQRDAHISMEIVTLRLKPRIKRIFFLISAPFGVVFCLILEWQLCRLLLLAYKRGAVSYSLLHIPMIYPYSLAVAGVALLILTYFFKIGSVILKRYPEELSKHTEVE